MLRPVFFSICLAFAVALATADAISQTTSDSFRCQDNNLVSLGASMYEVIHLCGEPDSVNVLGDPTADAVWVYDMGRTEYIYYLEFSRGRLTRISHRGERGFK
jgi:Protein of unknown function (DUF2845)